MGIIPIILSVLALSTLFCIFLKPRIGAMLYLIYMYFAPYLYIGGSIIYARTIALIFLFAFLWKFKKKMKRQDYAPFFPYIMFLVWQFVLLFTSEIVQFSFNQWFTSCSNLFFVLFLYGNIQTYKYTTKWYSATLFGVFCIITFYGIFLTAMPGLNPYQMVTQPLFGSEFNEAYAAGNSGLSTSTQLADGRLFGRISSVFSHPMAYGLNLGLFFIFSLYYLKDKPKYLLPVLLCIFVAILVSGIRTPLGALAITSLFIMLYLRKFKYFIYGTIAFLIVICSTTLISPETGEYMMSIINSDDTETKGSNVTMRLEQLEGCFDIVKSNILTGKGYGWHKWYNGLYGTHPKVLWFESIIFSILVNTGIAGFIIWGYFVRGYYKFVTRNIKDVFTQAVFLALMVYYLTYSTITGEFGIQYMFIFYTVLLGLVKFTDCKEALTIKQK